MFDVYEKVFLVSMFNDWLIYKMIGKFVVELSNGLIIGIINFKKCIWNFFIMKKCGFKDNIFLLIVECGLIIGKVNLKGVEDIGFVEGIIVVVGGGDVQFGCIGVGVVNLNEGVVFGGSFW